MSRRNHYHWRISEVLSLYWDRYILSINFYKKKKLLRFVFEFLRKRKVMNGSLLGCLRACMYEFKELEYFTFRKCSSLNQNSCKASKWFCKNAEKYFTFLKLNSYSSLLFLQALWQLLWVNHTTSANSVKSVPVGSANKRQSIEVIQQRVSIVVSELLSQVEATILLYI